MLMLNFFENFWSKIYNVDVAWYVVAGSLILAILCMSKMIKKKDDKKPIKWGWFLFSLIFIGICVAYSLLLVK